MRVLAILLALCAPSKAATGLQSTLRWGDLFNESAVSPHLKKYRARVVEVGASSAGKAFTPVHAILSEGKLRTDPGVAESEAATSEIKTLLKLAVCARLASDADLRRRCRATAVLGLRAWGEIYVPTGNPINEMQFIPWVQAWDVLKPTLSSEENAPLKDFALKLAAAGDAFYAGLKPKDGRRPNNWGTWRLCLRSLIAVVAEDRALIESSRELAAEHAAQNLYPDGGSIDFKDRDALHYHVYDMQAFTEMALQLPEDFFSDADRASIERGIVFLKPFVSGDKKHVEFVGSRIPFDIKRRQAGEADYQNAPWKPASARGLLRLARAAFPGVRPWTQNIVDEEYDPMLKLEAAAFGD